ncbi:MAG: hypothetical protein HOG49_19945 [Candidatus Scalindua sp.]|jgi:hypothetical protein|nr:hypothetical protein [Candidatus Scalindua sp.]
MTTSNTTPCINCGHNISRNAQSCPKCKNACFDCLLCKRPIKNQDLYRYTMFRGKSYHKDCIRKYFQIPQSIRCPDCNIVLAETNLQTQLFDFSVHSPSSTCPNCGCPDPLKKVNHDCPVCGLIICSSFQKVGHHRSHFWDGATTIKPMDLHEFCAKGLL